MDNGLMKIIPFNTGYCIGPAKVACRTKRSKKVRFTAQAFLLQTKEYGNILFDTGYAQAYHEHVPFFYNWILPTKFSPKESLKSQLEKQGFSLSDISYVFISHYHVDHIAGLKDLKGIPWIYRKDALDTLKKKSKLKAFMQGFFSGLIPDIPAGSIPILDSEFKNTFLNSELKSCNLFSDPSFQIVDLPGHALGQMGLCYGNIFLAADAIWSKESFAKNTLPSFFGLLLQHDRRAYVDTFYQIQKIKEKHPQFQCIPTHTMEVL